MATTVKEHPKRNPIETSASSQATPQGLVKKYKPGHNPRTLANLMRGPAPSRDGPEDDEGGATNLYAAMKAVANNHPKRDRGQFERNCRKWLRKDGRGFLMKLADLEKVRLAAKLRRFKARKVRDDEDEEIDDLSDLRDFKESDLSKTIREYREKQSAKDEVPDTFEEYKRRTKEAT